MLKTKTEYNNRLTENLFKNATITVGDNHGDNYVLLYIDTDMSSDNALFERWDEECQIRKSIMREAELLGVKVNLQNFDSFAYDAAQADDNKERPYINLIFEINDKKETFLSISLSENNIIFSGDDELCLDNQEKKMLFSVIEKQLDMSIDELLYNQIEDYSGHSRNTKSKFENEKE